MPPNLGGFFMVRSYYPSECHADYFDFESIEALKPAIEACGISTLSQSPMLGFHKQMDNRIKLLEEILSFRIDRKSGSAGMPRPISYAVFCLKKKKNSIITNSWRSRQRLIKLVGLPADSVQSVSCRTNTDALRTPAPVKKWRP